MKTSCAGEIVKIHNPSPERMEPECPYAGKCGGCAYRHLTYPEELWAKRQRVQDALTRIGGLELTVEEILGTKNPEHYRNKSQYPVGADGSIGFFQARTHKVVPIRRCLIQTEAADRTAQAVGEWMRRYKISAYDETTGKGLVRHVCVRVNRKGESLCCVVVNGNKVPREPELAGYVTAAGAPYRRRPAEQQHPPGQCGLRRQISDAVRPELSDGHPLRTGIQAGPCRPSIR